MSTTGIFFIQDSTIKNLPGKNKFSFGNSQGKINTSNKRRKIKKINDEIINELLFQMNLIEIKIKDIIIQQLLNHR